MIRELANARGSVSVLAAMEVPPASETDRLRQSEERFRLVVEAAPSAMIMVDDQGAITLINSQTERLFGYSRSELLGRPIEMLVPERYRANHPGFRDGFFARPQTRAMGAGRDLFGLRRDGSEVAIEIGLNPIVSAEGRFVLASIIDITERKRAEERFRLVVEAAPNAMIMVDSSGLITLINSQTERLFGYTRAELLGRSIDELVPERFRGRHPGFRADFFVDPHARPMGAGRDLFGLRKDGTEVPIEIGLNPISSAEGTFVLASIIDITERKRAESAIHASLMEKETLLKEIHHRVKNNLQVISSILNLQAGHLHDDRDRAMFEECQQRVRGMAMIHERLYRSHSLSTLDFGEHLRQLVQMLVRSYDRRGIALELQIEPVVLDLDTAIPLGLIVNELVTNALRHAYEGQVGGILQVHFGRTHGDLGLVVADNGRGMPPGFEIRTAKSLGMKMIQTLTGQLRGTLHIDTDPGTKISLRFQVNETKSPQPL